MAGKKILSSQSIVSIRKTFSYAFKVWSCVFILMLVPLDFLYRATAFLKYMSPLDMVFELSAMIMVFSVLAALPAIFSIVLMLPAVWALEDRAKSSIIFINTVMGTATAGLIGLVLAKKWADKSGLSLSPMIMTCLLLVLASVFLFARSGNRVPAFYNGIKRFFNGPFKFKVVNGLIIISTAIVILRIITGTPFEEKLLASKDKYSGILDLTKAPNIILITADALSAEDMSLYGYGLKTTPNMDNLAKESYVFDNAISNCNWTRPSVTSLLTGMYPSTHNITSYDIFMPDAKRFMNLPNVLRSIGYQTIAVSGNLTHAHPSVNDTYRDFDLSPFDARRHKPLGYVLMENVYTYFLDLRLRTPIWFNNIMKEYFERFVLLFYRQERQFYSPAPPERTFEVARQNLKNISAPFFLWVHTYTPHHPYLPSDKYKYTFLKDAIFDRYDRQSFPVRYAVNQQPTADRLRLRYDELILNTDAELKNFLDYIKESGYWDNSIIIFSSDHGESFERGHARHGGPYLYQPLIHVPLLIHMPGQKDGKRIKTNAEQIDIAPTVLDFLGLDMPPWMEGESLKKAMHEDYISKKPKFSLNLKMKKKSGPVTEGSIAVISDDYKYIYYVKENKGELYDLVTDPKENVDLSVKEKQKSGELKKLIFQKIITPSYKPER